MPVDGLNKIDMTQINAYITFSGNCREAMNFYKEVLDGELALQTIGESPMAEKLPANMRNYILHAQLTKGDLTLMASDMVSDQGLVKGNSITLMLACHSEEEIKNCYKKLSVGGKATHPLEDTFLGAVFGGLTDKFGNHWLLNFEKRKAN